MTKKRLLILLTVAFSLLPLVLPARQLAVGDSVESESMTAPETAAVLALVKNLDDR